MNILTDLVLVMTATGSGPCLSLMYIYRGAIQVLRNVGLLDFEWLTASWLVLQASAVALTLRMSG